MMGSALAPAEDLKGSVRKYEIELIVRALVIHPNQRAAAKALKLPLRTLVYKIQTYGIKAKVTGSLDD
jgi:transcriptional regulator with PAS, ATPase and Fis domain